MKKKITVLSPKFKKDLLSILSEESSEQNY